MPSRTAIEWTEHTWNPIVGCSVVSPGCTNCYAMRQAARLEAMGSPIYRGLTETSKAGPVWRGKVELASSATLAAPLHRQKPTVFFVNSMGDLFHEAVPDEWIDQVFVVMALAPQHTFQVLTKRSARMRQYISAVVDTFHASPDSMDERFSELSVELTDSPCASDAFEAVDWPLRNVWLGVSAEDQRRADERIPDLLATPAAVRFVSCEPLLGPVNLAAMPFPDGDPRHRWNALTGQALAYAEGVDGHPDTTIRVTKPIKPRLDWVIAGGESGPNARPMHPDWARSLRDQCAAAEVPFFFKQWGAWGTTSQLMTTGEPVFRMFTSFQQWVNKASTWVNGGTCIDTQGRILRRGADFQRARDEGSFPVAVLDRVGKTRAGRLLDGREHNDMPVIRSLASGI